ncbi:MAG: carboxypeptidase-like regulatory domain-containing protein, partial [Acidobacteriota bacterium]|nr:carboxypeptidase-like regulatory domain-containing protein [Acidobacteriota bacterium]
MILENYSFVSTQRRAGRMLLASLLVLVLHTGFAYGQDFRATITGQVTDPNNAAVPNATVKATRVGTNITTEAQTNDEGYYTLPYLNPGTYL